MAVSLEIRPHSHSLDMYGEANKFAAYSLSGDIIISVSPSNSFFDRRRAVRLLLQSLVVDFEGQCELITPETGYAAYRLCHISKELILDEPVEISNEGHEGSDKQTSYWNVTFALVVPGWLPPTTSYAECEQDDAGTHYSLYATAKLQDIDDEPSRSWFSSCWSPFSSHTQVVNAPRCEVPVNRYMGGPAGDSSLSQPCSFADYTLSPERRTDVQLSSAIPFDVLSKIRTIVSVPEYIDTADDAFPICLRLRTKDLPESECKRLRISDFSMDVEQTEHYRVRPSSGYKATYPVPPASEQPPHVPLRHPHPLQPIYQAGLGSFCTRNAAFSRAVTLLPNQAPSQYALTGDGYLFKEDARPQNASTWFSIRTRVPLGHGVEEECDTSASPQRLHESGSSPLFVVTHRLHVSLTCTYDVTESEEPERATEELRFDIPIRFARVRPTCLSQSRPLTPSVGPLWTGQARAPAVDSTDCRVGSVVSLVTVPSLPYGPTLPAYSQLYEPNGDRKIDYSVLLPAYTPPLAPCQPYTPSPSMPPMLCSGEHRGSRDYKPLAADQW
ncbi:hypothetical protein WOLCODRAFT_148705 [Wolfiporia cocos MD-104 SS10]|uniref:Arrestin-like N-terminal domain-containing protein n=1 Tax=Wolfiporia cocos (strain MD-104) TaxID=742152 RepID=A0A2H3JG69_WOLCO|nr:hypothetical protein WOLCODRAFT_148705 [Wolfiporia cocos MD-104 SS10]